MIILKSLFFGSVVQQLPVLSEVTDFSVMELAILLQFFFNTIIGNETIIYCA